MIMQKVVPQPYHQDILSMVHDGPFSAHMGIRKPYDHVLRRFFWPRLKADVVKKTVIRVKPNQVTPPVPL